jgi:hypothetical protein
VKVTSLDPAAYAEVAAAVARTVHDPAAVKVNTPLAAFTAQPVVPAVVTE